MDHRRQPIVSPPDTGIPDLIRELADDSKRLAGNEVRLAKLELRENVHTAARGTLRIAVAFGVGVVALTAATIMVAAGIGQVIGHNFWLGAIVTGILELVLAAVLVKRGIGAFTEPSYSLEETRESLKGTQAWVRAQRAD